MKTQRARRTHGSDRFQESAADSLFLHGARHSAKNRVSGEQPRYGNGQRTRRHVVERGKTLVVNLLLAALRIEFDNLDGQRIVEVSRWIVKREMAIGADATTDNINRRSLELGGIL